MPAGNGEARSKVRTRPDTVHKVLHLVATHPESWEGAARLAIAEATRSIRDLHHARVVRLDAVIGGDGIARYRAKLEMSFQLDRTRPGATMGAPDVVVTRFLVVANRTLASPHLMDAVNERIRAGAAEFHVLVPATSSDEYLSARRALMLGDPLTGFVPTDVVPLGIDERAHEEAQERLDDLLAHLAAAGATATGEIGDPDPLQAIGAVLERGSFDEVILSTLPAGVSKWLGMDLPSRVRRTVAVPVTVVETAAQ
jgi:GABA permease